MYRRGEELHRESKGEAEGKNLYRNAVEERNTGNMEEEEKSGKEM